MELTQGSSAPRMAALFTFVARNALDGRPQPINPLAPEGKAAQEAFCERQRIADARKAARAKSKETGLQCECCCCGCVLCRARGVLVETCFAIRVRVRV